MSLHLTSRHIIVGYTHMKLRADEKLGGPSSDLCTTALARDFDAGN
jgi:hypothetical protein